MKLWIGIYDHKHGNSHHPIVSSERPSDARLMEVFELDEEDKAELEAEREFLGVEGPWDLEELRYESLQAQMMTFKPPVVDEFLVTGSGSFRRVSVDEIAKTPLKPGEMAIPINSKPLVPGRLVCGIDFAEAGEESMAVLSRYSKSDIELARLLYGGYKEQAPSSTPAKEVEV